MGRTYRKQAARFRLGVSLSHKKNKNGSVRDGTPTHFSGSCEHHGGCPVCEGNRLFNTERKLDKAKRAEEA